ncbi:MULTISPECIES: hypothetical protein [unclassified Paenibacillus]|nr:MULTISPECIES: hypothetical protein [unclassified Paenibacillus]QID16060.1 hypothetical protein CIC07_25360 [Paenibacillus sp. RUD330]
MNQHLPPCTEAHEEKDGKAVETMPEKAVVRKDHAMPLNKNRLDPPY